MNSSIHLIRTVVVAIVLAGTLAACDSTSALETTADQESIELFASELSSELALTSEQSAVVNATLSRMGDAGLNDPGFLWRLAAELSDTLTEEQKEQLLSGAIRNPGDLLGDGPSGGRMGGNGMRPQGPPSGGMNQGGERVGTPLTDILTEAQLEELKAVREARRAELEELFAAVRAAREAGDSAAAQAAHDAIKAIHDEVKAAVEAYFDANLTQEQKDAIAAAEAEREAARAERQAAERAVMIEVLGIGDAQADDLLAAVDAFREALRALDRSTDVSAEMEALRTDLEASIAATLGNDAAFEIWQIHEVLARRAQRHGRRGGPGIGGRPAGGAAGR